MKKNFLVFSRNWKNYKLPDIEAFFDKFNIIRLLILDYNIIYFLQQAQYVGAQPLQETAFANVGDAAANYQDTLASAGTTLGSAVSATSPLSSAQSYLAAGAKDPASQVANYINPYTTSVLNQIGNLGQRNIMQNLGSINGRGIHTR